MTSLFPGVMATLTLLLAAWLGWATAHSTVATECDRLGAFYVQSTVYECKVKR